MLKKRWGITGMQQRHKGLRLKGQLHLGGKRVFNKTVKWTFRMEVMK
jgi:hypothetical protein